MKENRFIPKPGEKEPILSSKYYDIPGNWAHGIMARQYLWTSPFPMHSHEHHELEYVAEGDMSKDIALP